MELINTELNKEDALKNISLKVEALNHLNKPESVFLCQTLNGQIQDFNNLSLDEDLTEIRCARYIHNLCEAHQSSGI